MELLNSFQPTLHCYEGLGDLYAPKIPGRSQIAAQIPFEARQLHDGQIVCAWMVPGAVDSFDVEVLEGVVHQPPAKFLAEGLQLFHNSMSPGVSSGVGYASRMRIDGVLASKHAPTHLEFSIVNLAFGRSNEPAPLDIEADGYSLRFSPLPDYTATRERLKRMSGIAPTATCGCTRLDKKPVQPDKAAEVVDSACVALSLATGNKVVWINWQSASNPALATWFHRSPSTKPFSNMFTAFGWQLDLAKIVSSWVTAKEKSYLRPMVDYFLDAAGQGAYLETRALTAASLLDALTNHYAEQQGLNVLLDDDEWKTARPVLRRTLKEIHPLLELNLNGLRRRPFREKLTRLLNDQNLPSDDVDRIVRIRDKLVHSGTFLKDMRRLDQYLTLLRAAFAILARLTGYSYDIWPALTWPLAGED